jgi:YegS/Rv2252/BmrU family lipid kinase
MPIPLFLNPVAGRGRARRIQPSLSNLLTASGIEHTVIESDAPRDLEQKVAAAAGGGASQILIAGGDGSVHEAVNGLQNSGKFAEVGVIPLGIDNDFAKACAIPSHWEDAAMLLVDRLKNSMPARPVDIGRMNERCFINNAGIGFDAKIAGIARDLHFPIADLVYPAATVQALWDGVSTHAVTAHFNDEVFSGEVTMISINNGPWIGGMLHIAPSAINDDGVLDLLVTRSVSRLRIVTLLPKLIAGTHIGEPEISHARITKCEIVATEPLMCQLDGEPQPLQARFQFDLLPGALPLL